MDLNDPKTYEEWKHKLGDKDWRLNNLYYIKNKKRKTVKFKLNEAQASYRATKHNKNIILKARQQGFTTFACIDALDNCLFNSNFEAGIIAHKEDDAKKIFYNKVKFAFDRLPEIIRLTRKPNTDRAGELSFPIGSIISVSTGFRGGTLSSLHISEYGKICAKFPEKAREIKAGAFEAVPIDGEITVESTAEGMSGDFFEMCNKAQIKEGQKLTELDFKFHFYAWWQSQEYRLNPEGIEISKEFEEYFKQLKDNHGIDLDAWQKAWYVKKSENQKDMKQEYPSYPEEAFLASGRPVFDLVKISADIKKAKLKAKTAKRGFLDDDGKFKEDPEGTVIVFKMPVKDAAYTVTGDPAEGLEDGDNSAASVLDKNFEQCAVYAGKMDTDTFGAFLVKLAKFYNNALVAHEMNNHGHAVLSAIKQKKYYKLFKRDGAAEELGKDVLDKVGWLNTAKSKMLMIDELIAAYRDGSLTVNCEATLREMMTVVYEEDGNVILTGKDRVVALGISIQGIKQATVEGTHKAVSPNKAKDKDVTKMNPEEKIKYYNRMNRK
jgi:hypothetical protein